MPVNLKVYTVNPVKQFFEDYILLKSILVGNEASYCQIDSLIIYQKFISDLLKLKIYLVYLVYDEESHQLTRQRDNGSIDGMGNPERSTLDEVRDLLKRP